MLCATASGLGAVEVVPTTFHFFDLRVGGQTTPAPEVTETIHLSTGPVELSWGDSRRSPRFSALGIVGWSDDNNGPILGAEISVARHRLGGSIPGQGEVEMRQVGVDVLAGWQLGIVPTSGIHGHLEAAPIVGTNLGWFDRGDRSYGFATEYGLRLGAFLDERSWTAGITGTWIRSRGRLEVEVATSNSNTVEYSITGWRWGAEVGYRF